MCSVRGVLAFFHTGTYLSIGTGEFEIKTKWPKNKNTVFNTGEMGEFFYVGPPKDKITITIILSR